MIVIYHNRTSSMIPTGIRVSPKEWNGSKVINNIASGAINAKLAKQKENVDRVIAILSFDEKFDMMTASQIKAECSSNKPKAVTGYFVRDIFSDYMKTGIKDGTKEIYKSTLSKVLAFGGDGIKMDRIDLKWLHGFEQFLAKTQGVNGRGIYLRSLRAVCNYARHTGAMANHPFENFSIKTEPTQKRSVSADLLRKFKDYPATPQQSKYRDYFFLMFYLIGINTKDLLLAKKDAIVNGRLEYIREKTHKKYSIKIEPEAQELIDKYAGENYLLEAMDHCVHYKSFGHMMNDSLKEIGDIKWEMIPNPDNLFDAPKLIKTIEPVIPGITTYYARHSWATIAYEIGIPMEVISDALGHSFGNRTTLIYVKKDPAKIDDANRAVIDRLNEII